MFDYTHYKVNLPVARPRRRYLWGNAFMQICSLQHIRIHIYLQTIQLLYLHIFSQFVLRELLALWLQALIQTQSRGPFWAIPRGLDLKLETTLIKFCFVSVDAEPEAIGRTFVFSSLLLTLCWGYFDCQTPGWLFRPLYKINWLSY